MQRGPGTIELAQALAAPLPAVWALRHHWPNPAPSKAKAATDRPEATVQDDEQYFIVTTIRLRHSGCRHGNTVPSR